MAVYGVVRIGFQGNANANNKVRYALTGTIKTTDPESPFVRRNTGLFTAESADNAEVAKALTKLMKVIECEAESLDIFSVTITKAGEPEAQADLNQEGSRTETS